MKQLNLHTTKQFLSDIGTYMRHRGLKTKSEAIRSALREVVEAVEQRSRRGSFRNWLGAGLREPRNPSPRFKSEDDLWEKNGH